jgi:beta-N-acetylhexosaminidase
MIGQTIVGRFTGAVPPAGFLEEVRAGDLGGVILFGENVADGQAATKDLDHELQSAAREGGNPPLLIMTDQEGGEVKRLSWAPPLLAAAEMTSPAVAQAEGEATGRALRGLGINVDLAPVVDVLHVAESFLGTRSFGSDPATVAERACAFAEGLERQGTAYTLKHFPGLGRALTNTDVQPTTVQGSVGELEGDLAPYVACGGRPDAIVMVNSASYPSLTGTSTPAVLSPVIYERYLPRFTGAHPLTISDDLQAAGLADEPAPGPRAFKAGLDMLLYAQTAEAAQTANSEIHDDVENGTIPRARVMSAYRAVEAMKARVAGAHPVAMENSASSQAGTENGSYTESLGAPETIRPTPGAAGNDQGAG